MNTYQIKVVLLAAMSAVTVGAGAIEFVECPKCDRWMRISADGKSATVNLSRLKDDAPDPTTFGRRKAEMSARAEWYLTLGRNVATGDRRCPLMGWSSWNTFGVDISEEIILDTARAMATNGLKEAGYRYVNIDDGFFNGHGEDGVLRFHPKRFPRGMKPTVDGIHALGLKAGIYSDAGADTCGSMWGGSGADGKDLAGVGAGLYGHDAADCQLHFNDLGFDFIKVDYCGGGKLGLPERERYAEIGRAILATGRTDVRYNLCRWAFPGTWAADIADSWRTTEDIRANWRSVRKLIGENLYLSAYASPGHYNDMDMLEVGQRKGAVKSIFGQHGDTGLTEDEEVTHFGMWCMMSSPLLVGCDVRTLPAFTKRLITNPYLIALNQNCGLGVQGSVVQREGEAYVLVKDADERFGTSRYVALYNAGDAEHEFCVRSAALDLGGRIAAFDLVDRSDIGAFEGHVFVKVPPHGARFFRFDAERREERTVYEAEAAFLSDYQELRDPVKAETAFPDQVAWASGGVAVRYLGQRASNDLVWKDVQILKPERRILEFACATPEARSFRIEVDGADVGEVRVPSTAGLFETFRLEVDLTAGLHRIRLFNASAWMPDIDRMVLR
ncbi:MAG: alpha-galactosidase [Kiritimatiellia bacterium]